MKPARTLSITDRYRLKELEFEQSQVPTPGRVMFCRGRSILGYGDVVHLGEFLYVPKRTDTICLSAADYADVKVWIG
jgi:hypothetical protein